MATGSFGHAEGLNYAHYGGVPYYANCGMRAIMPENGKVLSIKLYLGKNTTTNCTAWGMIWNRNTGGILAQSAAQTITNSATSGITGLQHGPVNALLKAVGQVNFNNGGLNQHLATR